MKNFDKSISLFISLSTVYFTFHVTSFHFSNTSDTHDKQYVRYHNQLHITNTEFKNESNRIIVIEGCDIKTYNCVTNAYQNMHYILVYHIITSETSTVFEDVFRNGNNKSEHVAIALHN